MANIDVSELLVDPDFVDPVTILRTEITMTQDGTYTETIQTITGVLMSVQPASGQTLMIVPEDQRVDGMLEVWTQFALRESNPDADPVQKPDRIVWKGRTLLLTKLDSWQNYGNGYSHGVCTLQAMGGIPDE